MRGICRREGRYKSSACISSTAAKRNATRRRRRASRATRGAAGAYDGDRWQDRSASMRAAPTRTEGAGAAACQSSACLTPPNRSRACSLARRGWCWSTRRCRRFSSPIRGRVRWSIRGDASLPCCARRAAFNACRTGISVGRRTSVAVPRHVASGGARAESAEPYGHERDHGARSAGGCNCL